MKKVVILFGLLLMGIIVNAQSRNKLSFLVYGGANSLYFTEELPIYEMHNNYGYTLGGAVRYGKRTFVQVGVEMASMNVKMAARTANSSVVYDDKLSLQLYQVPIMVGAKVLSINDDFANIRLMLGGKVGVISPKSNVFQLSASNFATPVLTPSIGLGVDVWRITLDFNYQYGGVSPIFKNYADKSQLHTAAITLGVKL